jgi:hypothetical protein
MHCVRYVASARCVGWSVGLVALCLVVISLGGNRMGNVGAAAIGAGVHAVPSLTSLKYVMQAWVVCVISRTFFKEGHE